MTTGRWTNWAGNHEITCDLVAPQGLDELCETVKRAAAPGRHIRAAGGSFSWAPLVPNDDTIVRMHRLDKVLHYDDSTHRIEVQGGMTVEALNRYAAGRGMTLTSPTLFPKPTIGGAISTGSHGTDSSAGNFADSIVELKIVDARGELQTVGEHDPELPAAKVALGALGIIYSVTLQLVPQYDVCVEIRSLPVCRALEEFEDLRKSYEFLELFWFPFQKNIWIYMMNRTQIRPDRRSAWSRLKTDLTTTFQDFAAQSMIPWIAKHTPRLTPTLNSFASRLAFKTGYSVRTASEAFHFQKAYAKCWDLEYGVPAGDAPQAWGEAVALVEHYADSALYPINLAVHGRFTGASDGWIAPDHGRPTCYVEVTSAKGTPHWESFFREMELIWCAIPGARPHWGKLYWQRDRIAAQYPKMNAFLDVRQRWDPERVFLNRFLDQQVFQLPRRPEPQLLEPGKPPRPPPPPSVQPLLLS